MVFFICKSKEPKLKKFNTVFEERETSWWNDLLRVFQGCFEKLVVEPCLVFRLLTGFKVQPVRAEAVRAS